MGNGFQHIGDLFKKKEIGTAHLPLFSIVCIQLRFHLTLMTSRSAPQNQLIHSGWSFMHVLRRSKYGARVRMNNVSFRLHTTTLWSTEPLLTDTRRSSSNKSDAFVSFSK